MGVNVDRDNKVCHVVEFLGISNIPNLTNAI